MLPLKHGEDTLSEFHAPVRQLVRRTGAKICMFCCSLFFVLFLLLGLYFLTNLTLAVIFDRWVKASNLLVTRFSHRPVLAVTVGHFVHRKGLQ
jgi:hypothetical protein